MPKKKAMKKSGPADLRVRIHTELTARPGQKTVNIGPAMGVDPEFVRHELIKMETEGLARREGRTRGTTWFVTTAEIAAPAVTDAAAATATAVVAERPSRKPRPAKVPRKTLAAVGDVFYGWRASITINGKNSTERIMVAPTIAEAGAIAAEGARALGGEVERLDRLDLAFSGVL